MLPTYVVTAISLAWLELYIWIVGVLVMSIITDLMYFQLVLTPGTDHIGIRGRYLIVLFGQAVFWGAVLLLIS